MSISFCLCSVKGIISSYNFYIVFGAKLFNNWYYIIFILLIMSLNFQIKMEGNNQQMQQIPSQNLQMSRISSK